MASPIFLSLDDFPMLGFAIQGQGMSITMKAKIVDSSEEAGSKILALEISDLDVKALEQLSVHQTIQLQAIARNTGVINTPTP